MSIGRPTPRIRLFQALTLKFQSQGHGCGQKARSYSRPSILLIHFLFISHQSEKQFLRYSYFAMWPLKSKVKVMREVKGQGHILYPVSKRYTSFSFHINRKKQPWDMAKLAFDHEKTHPKFSKEYLPKLNISTEFLQVQSGYKHDGTIRLSCFVIIGMVVFTLSKVIQYISPDLYILCPNYLRFNSNGFDVRGKSRCGGRHSGRGRNELKT